MNIIESIIKAIIWNEPFEDKKAPIKEVKDPFEESNRFIDHAKRSYLEILQEEERIIRESANPSESNP